MGCEAQVQVVELLGKDVSGAQESCQARVRVARMDSVDERGVVEKVVLVGTAQVVVGIVPDQPEDMMEVSRVLVVGSMAVDVTVVKMLKLERHIGWVGTTAESFVY
jgi:hypothetical protein